jgi:hypothetical protein
MAKPILPIWEKTNPAGFQAFASGSGDGHFHHRIDGYREAFMNYN